MLLNCEQIKDLLEDGVIEGALYENINAASLDITLGDTILQEALLPNDMLGFHPQVVELGKRTPLNFKSVKMDHNGYVIEPGEFILAQTREIFHLPSDIACEYKLKSSMARMGLEHLNAGWCDPDWNNSVLTLELRNLTTYHSIRIRPGDKIGQMIFFKVKPVPTEHSYATKGSYNSDLKVQASKESK